MTHEVQRVTLRRSVTLRRTLLGCSLALVSSGVARAQEVRVMQVPGGERRITWTMNDRPMIGVTTTEDSDRADTLGLKVESVMEGSPAEKAGLKAGDRLQAVNGISLRADRADAGEDDYAGVLTRRLQRAVHATEAGKAVTLRVLSGTAVRDVSVIPVKGSELQGERGMQMFTTSLSDDRAVLGINAASTGSARDTLGVFVQSVTKDGPAEKAGIYEGDRIAAINGVSLRVAREDAEDHAVGASRAERLSREMAKLKAGDAAELVVISAGRSRTVRVTSVKASDLPDHGGMPFFLKTPGFEGMRVIPRRPDMREMPEAPEMTGFRAMPLRHPMGSTHLKVVPHDGALKLRRMISTTI